LKQIKKENIMACIIKKIKKGRPYYYAVESARVNGKPRIVWQKYLGTIDNIVKRASSPSSAHVKEAVILEAGGIAAMLQVAKQIGLVEIINKIVPQKTKGPSVGEYIILAALNRILAPCSKQKMPDWYENTILFRLWKYPPNVFNSQRFWDHMDLISEDNIKEIQDMVVTQIKTTFNINSELLLYDTTNFFTYIATNNKRNSVAQRGRSKAKRDDLRQVGLAVLVTKDFQIPLFHRVYQGNLVDRGLFPEMASEMLSSCKKADISNSTTLVFDKGNVSENAMERIIVCDQDFVCAVPKNTSQDIFETNIDNLKPVLNLPGTKALCFDVEIWDKKCKAVLTYTESYFSSQLADLTIKVQKCEEALRNLDKDLLKWNKKKHYKNCPTIESVKRSVQNIVSQDYIQAIVKFIIEVKDGIPRVSYSIDQNEFNQIIKHQLGRTLLITSHLTWDEEQVISAYRGLNAIEDIFKRMKNIDYLHWQPAFHWTDQKIAVHGLYCVLAVLLAALAHKIVRESQLEIPFLKMLDELSGIREVAVIYTEKTSENRKDCITLSRMSTIQRKLAEILKIGDLIVGNTKKSAKKTKA
jgi:transposase